MSKAEDCAMAASMYGFMRSVGMPLGVAVSSHFPLPDAISLRRTNPASSCQGTLPERHGP
jgi:hypothetical protein